MYQDPEDYDPNSEELEEEQFKRDLELALKLSLQDYGVEKDCEDAMNALGEDLRLKPLINEKTYPCIDRPCPKEHQAVLEIEKIVRAYKRDEKINNQKAQDHNYSTDAQESKEEFTFGTVASEHNVIAEFEKMVLDYEKKNRKIKEEQKESSDNDGQQEVVPETPTEMSRNMSQFYEDYVGMRCFVGQGAIKKLPKKERKKSHKVKKLEKETECTKVKQKWFDNSEFPLKKLPDVRIRDVTCAPETASLVYDPERDEQTVSERHDNSGRYSPQEEPIEKVVINRKHLRDLEYERVLVSEHDDANWASSFHAGNVMKNAGNEGEDENSLRCCFDTDYKRPGALEPDFNSGSSSPPEKIIKGAKNEVEDKRSETYFSECDYERPSVSEGNVDSRKSFTTEELIAKIQSIRASRENVVCRSELDNNNEVVEQEQSRNLTSAVSNASETKELTEFRKWLSEKRKTDPELDKMSGVMKEYIIKVCQPIPKDISKKFHRCFHMNKEMLNELAFVKALYTISGAEELLPENQPVDSRWYAFSENGCYLCENEPSETVKTRCIGDKIWTPHKPESTRLPWNILLDTEICTKESASDNQDSVPVNRVADDYLWKYLVSVQESLEQGNVAVDEKNNSQIATQNMCSTNENGTKLTENASMNPATPEDVNEWIASTKLKKQLPSDTPMDKWNFICNVWKPIAEDTTVFGEDSLTAEKDECDKLNGDASVSLNLTPQNEENHPNSDLPHSKDNGHPDGEEKFRQ